MNTQESEIVNRTTSGPAPWLVAEAEVGGAYCVRVNASDREAGLHFAEELVEKLRPITEAAPFSVFVPCCAKVVDLGESPGGFLRLLVVFESTRFNAP